MPRPAYFYFSGAVVLTVLIITIGGAAHILWWGVTSLGLVGYFYAVTGPAGFGKRNGHHGILMTSLLLPYLIIARLLPLIRGYSYPQANEVTDGIWVGRLPLWNEMANSSFHGVLDLTAELRLSKGPWLYRSLPWLDVVTPSIKNLEEAVAVIEELRQEGEPVLVACALGRGRSACTVAAWLLATKRASSVNDAIEKVRASRSIVKLRERHRIALHAFFQSHFSFADAR